MTSKCKKEEDLLSKIEDIRQLMIARSSIHPFHSNEVVSISKQLDQLLNEYSLLHKKNNSI